MTRPLATLVLALLTVAVLTAAPASARQLETDQPLDLSLKDADLLEVLGIFATIQDLTLDAPADLRGAVTVELAAVPWSQAMHAVCATNGLACYADAPRLIVRQAEQAGAQVTWPATVDLAQPINIDLIKAPLHQTLMAFGKIADVPVMIEEGVADVGVTVTLVDVPWTLALQEACRLGGCQAQTTADAIVIVPLAPEVVRAQRIDLDLDDAPLDLVLESFRGLPLWDGTLRLEVEPGAADRRVTVDVRGGTWGDLLDSLCDSAACDWQLIFDHHGTRTLRITFLDGVLASAHRLEAFDGGLREAATILGAAIALPVRPIAGLGGDQRVTWSAGDHLPRVLLDDLCAQASCRWHLRGRGVQLAPRQAALATRPAVGSRGPAFRVDLAAAGEPLAADSRARFSWAHAVQYVGTADGWQAMLVWLPLADARQVLLPVLVDCAADRSRPGGGIRVLDPIALPIEGLWHGEADGLALTLRPTDEDAETAVASPGTPAPGPCVADHAPSVVATVAGPRGQALMLDAVPGRFLLVTPPGPPPAGRSRPTAALVALGDDGETSRVLVVRVAADGSVRTLPLEVGREPIAVTVGDANPLTLDLHRAPRRHAASAR